MYRQFLALYAERFTADVSHGFSGFLYSLSTEIKRLEKKQCEDIESNLKAVNEAIGGFLLSTDSKNSWPGPFY